MTQIAIANRNRVKSSTLYLVPSTLVGLLSFVSKVFAEDLTIDENEVPGIQPVNFGQVLFFNFEQIRSFSFFSYIALGVQAVFLGFGLLWVYLMIKAAIKVIRSEGDEAAIEDAKKRFMNVAAGIGTLFGFFVVAVIAASAFGLGGFFEWPKRLSSCSDGVLYYVKALENSTATAAQIDEMCFKASGGTSVPR